MFKSRLERAESFLRRVGATSSRVPRIGNRFGAADGATAMGAAPRLENTASASSGAHVRPSLFESRAGLPLSQPECHCWKWEPLRQPDTSSGNGKRTGVTQRPASYVFLLEERLAINGASWWTGCLVFTDISHALLSHFGFSSFAPVDLRSLCCCVEGPRKPNPRLVQMCVGGNTLQGQWMCARFFYIFSNLHIVPPQWSDLDAGKQGRGSTKKQVFCGSCKA